MNHLLGVGVGELLDVGALGFGQLIAKPEDLGHRVCLLLYGLACGLVFLPHGDDHESKQHGVDHAQSRVDEARNVVVFLAPLSWHEALHHDSHEAYLCDIPTPLKWKIRKATNVYEETCDELDLVIAEAFGFEWPEDGSPDQRVIKDADKQALLIEAARLLPDGGKALRGDRELGEEEYRDLAPLEEPLPPADAGKRFLEAHQELAGYASQKP
jgi:hypothetical protein